MSQKENQPDDSSKQLLIKLAIFIGVAVATFFIASAIIRGMSKAVN